MTVSGDVELEGEFAARAQHRIETVSGDLSLGVVDGLTLEVRGLSSDTRVSVPHRSEGSRDRRRYIIGGGEGEPPVQLDVGRRLGPPRPASARPPTPPDAARASDPTDAADGRRSIRDEQLEILRALERGEIDVDEAAARLAGGSTDA